MKTASKAKAPATKKATASKPASKAKPAAATKAPAKAAKPASKPAKQASKPAKETTAQRHQRIATEVIGKPPAKAPKKALGKGIKELVEAPKAAAPAVIPARDFLAELATALKGTTELEQLALRSALTSSAGNGHDFGYTEQITIPGKSKQAVGGVITSLLEKGVLTRDTEFGQFWFGNPDFKDNHYAAAELVEKFLPPAPAPVEAPAPAPVKPSYVSKTGPDSKYHNPDRSTVKGPVAIMRGLCEENWPTGKMTRKQIIEAGMALGVTKNTAMTQFAMWKARYLADEAAAAD